MTEAGSRPCRHANSVALRPADVAPGGDESSPALPLTVARWLALALLVTVLPAFGRHPAAPLPSALEPARTGGLEVVDRALAKLSTHRRLLVVGAHPDDEDNALLALVAHGQGGEAAYLSLSRGEGGQNLIGPELGSGLGLLRTGELLAAREFDGAWQYFTRAFDFGYTRSLEETFTRWPREMLQEDAVRAVRRFKPQVVVAVFPADSRAGHGQHQASAVIAADVMELAGLPDRYPHLTAEGLPPWQPLALYRRAWSRDDATSSYRLGALDPLSGRSLGQIAAASRSRHRSQDMGREERLGAGRGGLVWIAGGAGVEGDGPFAGVDTRLAAIADLLPEGQRRDRTAARLELIAAAASELRHRLTAVDLEAAVPALAAIAGDLEAAVVLASVGAEEARGAVALLEEKRAVAQAALAAAAGVAVEAVADRETVTDGASFEVETSVWVAGAAEVEVRSVDLRTSAGWRVEATPAATGSAPPEMNGAPDDLGVRSWRLAVTVPRSSPPTLPYFLERERRGDVYDWSSAAAEVRGEAYQPPPLVARFALTAGGRPLTLEREVVYRTADQAVGEVRRPLRAVPRLEVEVEPRLIVWPNAADGVRELRVRVSSNVREAVSGQLHLELPEGWPPVEPRDFAIDDPRGSLTVDFALVRPERLEPAARGAVRGTVVAVSADATRYAAALPLVDYAHVRPSPMRTEAEVEIRTLDLELPRAAKLGYVRGASDRIPELLSEVGVELELLGPEDLAGGDFARFDAIVIGSRAYEIDSALARANGRLLDYVRAGGSLVVLYQQYQFVRGGFAPLPLEIARPHGRVTDETAPVRLLDPDHRLFVEPNRIGDEDWAGWVQERGLYFAGSWDEAYQPLMALADPGREEERGALLVARVGRGWYVYTGLSFFRELPAGVPGAYRLFANLLALGGSE